MWLRPLLGVRGLDYPLASLAARPATRSLLSTGSGQALLDLKVGCSTISGSAYSLVSTGSTSVWLRLVVGLRVSTDRSLRQTQDKRCATSKWVPGCSTMSGSAYGLVSTGSTGVWLRPLLGVRGLDYPLASLAARPATRSLLSTGSGRALLDLQVGSSLLDRQRVGVQLGFDRLNQRWLRLLVGVTGSRLSARFARCSTSNQVAPFDRLRTSAARPASGLVSTGSTSVGCGCLSAHGVSTIRSLRSLLDQQPGRSFRQAQDKRCSTVSGSAYGLGSTGSTSVGCGCLSACGVSTDRSLRQAQDKRFARCSTGAGRSLRRAQVRRCSTTAARGASGL